MRDSNKIKQCTNTLIHIYLYTHELTNFLYTHTQTYIHTHIYIYISPHTQLNTEIYTKPKLKLKTIIDCKDQIFFLLSVERNLCQD